MGVCTFSSIGNAWTCACGHAVEDDYVAHALGCNRLSGLVQSRHDDNAEVLRVLVGRLGLSSSREGRYSRLAPSTPNRPQARWDFHCNLRLGPSHVLADVSFSHPLAASYLRSAAEPLATQPLFGTLTSAGITRRTTPAAGMRSERYRLRPWGGLALAPCSSSAMPPTPPFPSPATSAQPASPTCTGSYRQYSAVTCPACVRLLWASGPRERVPAGSAARPRPLQRFCTDALLCIRPGFDCAPLVGQLVFGSFCS
jgi:hypothetical protein